MYIQSSQNNINMRGRGNNIGWWKRLKQRFLDTLPNATINDGERRLNRWQNFEDKLSRPAENRLIMGTTALMTQPAIDYYNHNVDEETREVSKNRTIAKIIAGTIVGIAVRGSSYKLVQKMTDVKGKSKYSKVLLPTKHLKELLDNKIFLKNYRSALATSLAILAMCITNFAIDAPLTIFLTNYFNHKNENKTKKQKKGVSINA